MTDKKPGQNSGKEGGIFREVGPRGGKRENFATVADNKTLPPTTTPGASWHPIRTTPDSKH